VKLRDSPVRPGGSDKASATCKAICRWLFLFGLRRRRIDLNASDDAGAYGNSYRNALHDSAVAPPKSTEVTRLRWHESCRIPLLQKSDREACGAIPSCH